MKKFISYLSICSLMFIIACGGGGSSSTPTPIVDASTHDSALIGKWLYATIDGADMSFLGLGVEFKSDGAYATIGYTAAGACDESGTWTTSEKVLTFTVTAVSDSGIDCSAIGGVAKNGYSVESNTLNLTDPNSGSVLGLTKL